MGHADSKSGEQLSAEEVIRAGLSRRLGFQLSNRRVPLPGGAHAQVDAVDGERKFFAEIYAHQGPLKGGQIHKIAGDVLKLITIQRAHPGSRAVIALADAEAAAGIRGWLAESIKIWDIEVLVIPIPDDLRSRLKEAQYRQRMVNPTAPEDELSGDGSESSGAS
jgi:hypothetical protein